MEHEFGHGAGSRGAGAGDLHADERLRARLPRLSRQTATDLRRKLKMRSLQPADWVRPRGYSNGIEAEGRVIFVAGQIGWNENGEFHECTLGGQFRQALKNVLTVLK